MSTVIHTAEHFSDRKAMLCPICGKIYIPAVEHAWQIGNWGNDIRYTNVCSYTCMRKWEKEQIEKDKGKNEELLDAIINLTVDQTLKEIAGLYLGSNYRAWKISEIVNLPLDEVVRYINEIEDMIDGLEEEDHE